jgi:hypothetical protein
MKPVSSGILRGATGRISSERLLHRKPTAAEEQLPTELPELTDFVAGQYAGETPSSTGETA